MMEASVLALITHDAIRAGTPLLLATTGEAIAERSGVVNLGLEGGMLAGALAAVAVHTSTNSFVAACVAAAVVGAGVGGLHATLVERWGIPMLASGICITFVGTGVTSVVGRHYVGRALPPLPEFGVPVLSAIPTVGQALFRFDHLVYLGLAFALAAEWLLARSLAGIRLRAAGEAPDRAALLGINVRATRVAACAIGGALGGLGGAHLALSFARCWLDGIAAGRGWMAVGLVALARWRPGLAIPACWGFGAVVAAQFNAQALGLNVSPYLLGSLPYVLTVAALLLSRVFGRGSQAPASLRAVR